MPFLSSLTAALKVPRSPSGRMDRTRLRAACFSPAAACFDTRPRDVLLQTGNRPTVLLQPLPMLHPSSKRTLRRSSKGGTTGRRSAFLSHWGDSRALADSSPQFSSGTCSEAGVYSHPGWLLLPFLCCDKRPTAAALPAAPAVSLSVSAGAALHNDSRLSAPSALCKAAGGGLLVLHTQIELGDVCPCWSDSAEEWTWIQSKRI